MDSPLFHIPTALIALMCVVIECSNSLGVAIDKPVKALSLMADASQSPLFECSVFVCLMSVDVRC